MTKISVTKDMPGIIADALAQLDFVFAAKRANVWGPNLDMHDMKFAEAVRGEGPLLKAEAQLKGITTDELAKEVWNRRQETLHRINGLETERQRLQDKIRAADCPADVAKVMKGVE